jgi:hypothetical protein
MGHLRLAITWLAAEAEEVKGLEAGDEVEKERSGRGGVGGVVYPC